MERFALNTLWISVGLVSPLLAIAAPEGGVIESGSATISHSGPHTQVNQASQSAVVGWDQFNVGADESVTFSVPNASSVTLNNIYDQHPSQIMGQVSSNGRLILANPNGLFFGANSQLNVGALVATTSGVELMGDQLILNGASTSAGIDHQGTVNASGSVAYFAPRIDLSGSVTSGVDIHVSNHTKGTVTLADSGIGFDVADSDEQSLNQKGINVTGTLRSDGGYIGIETAAVNSLYDAALNVEGLVSADSLVGDGGQVALIAGEGKTLVTGDISANSATSVGGDIQLAGEEVELADNATVSANGATGGGNVFIGGGWDYTSGPDLARRTLLNENTQVSADATSDGDGGDVWIWSETQSIVKGGLSAQGVGLTGDGGFVETSSKGQLIVETSPDVGSEFGKGGDWLLDPQYLRVVSFPVSGDEAQTGCPKANDCKNVVYDENSDEFTHVGGNYSSYIFSGFLKSVLEDGGDVTLKTTDPDPASWIWINSPINLNSNARGSLTLETAGTIYIWYDISAVSDDFSLVLKAGESVDLKRYFKSIDVGLVDFQTPSVFQEVPVTIDSNSVITQNGLVWNTQSYNLSFSTNSDLNSSEVGGSVNFSIGNGTLNLGNVGSSSNGMGALNILGTTPDIKINGDSISASSVAFNGDSTTVTSNNDFTMSADEILLSGNVKWSATDLLTFTNSTQTSTIKIDGNFTINMDRKDLSLDNVSDLSGYNGSLTLESINSFNIYGEKIQQGSIFIYVNNVNSYSSLTFDSPNLNFSNGFSWLAYADLDFSRETDLNSSTANSDFSFNLSGNNLSLGGVGLGINGIGGLTVSDVDVLTLRDSIVISNGGSQLDFGSTQVSSIQLEGNVSLITQDADISLIAITVGENDPVSGEAPTLSISSGSGNVVMESVVNTGDVAISSTGEVTANGSMTLKGDSLVIDARQFYVVSPDEPIKLVAGATIVLNAPIDSATATTSGLILEAGNRIDIGSVGQSNALGEFQLATGGTISLNGGTLEASSLSIDANNLSLTADTVMDFSGDSVLFNESDINGDGGQALRINAAGATVELDAVSVGTLTVDASQLTLKDSISTGNGDLDFSLVDSIVLSADTTLNAGLAGNLTLSDNISGAYDLSLNIEQGHLVLGDQSNSANKLNSLTLSDASPTGTNSTSKGIAVLELLDLSNTGVLSVSQNAEFLSENGNVVLTGTSIEAAGSSVTVSAGNQVRLSEINADGFTLVSASAVLDSDIMTLNRLDLSQAGAIQLGNDLRLTGPLVLSTGSGSTSVNGNHALTLDAASQNLTLFDMGNTEALDTLVVMNAGTLQLAGGITTQGLDGISLTGSRLDLTADTKMNTSSSNGIIDLSGIGINGEFTLTLNSGAGNVLLGNVGQDQSLTSLAIEDAFKLSLGGNIRTADTLLDLSNVESVSLVNDVRVDTMATDGAIKLGDTAIDGTFALSLATGAGTVQLAKVGQSVALQSLRLESTADLSLNQDISVIDGLTLSGNLMTLDSTLNSFGGKVTLASAAGVSMSTASSVDAFGDASLSADSGSIGLGKVFSQTGGIDLVARAGSIYNTLNDFVSIEDTSINLKAERVSLFAGQDIGSGPSDPIVLDVPQSGSIDLSFTAPLAYIVNINQAAITANGKVFDVLSDSQRAALAAYSSTDLSGEPYPWQGALAAPQPGSELFAITQPGYTLASNALLDGNTLVSDLPAVPNIRLWGDEWWLLYSRSSTQ